MTNIEVQKTDSDPECRQKIETLAESVPFLNRSDQYPVFLQLYSQLQSELEKLEQELAQELTRFEGELQAACQTACKELLTTRNRLAAQFEKLDSEGPPGSPALLELAALLENEFSDLYRRVRLYPAKALEQFSPQSRKLFENFKQLRSLLDQACRRLPQQLLLIQQRGGEESLKGKRILDVAGQDLIRFCCRSRFKLFQRIRFRFKSLQLRSRYRLISVALQEIGVKCLQRESRLDAAKLMSDHRTVHSATLSQLDSHWQVIRFNLETAVGELEETAEKVGRKNRPPEQVSARIEEISRLATDSLERTAENLLSLPATYSTFLEGTKEELKREFSRSLSTLQQDVEAAGTFRFRAVQAGRSIRRAVKALKSWLLARLIRLSKAVRKLARRLQYLAEDLFLSITSRLGVKIPTRESLLAVTDLPSISEVLRQAEALPPIYRRLFSFAPLKTREFLVGRKGDLEMFQEAVTRWREGLDTSLLLVGSEGTGKTTLLNCFCNELGRDIPVLKVEIATRLQSRESLLRQVESWFQLEQSESIHELTKALQALPRQVVMVEGGHNLMLRRIEGQKAAEAFFHLVMATRTHFLWILSIREYPWSRIEYQLKAAQYFTHTIRTLFHTQEELREALMARQNTTGFSTLFLDEGLKDRKIRKLRLSHPLESEPVQAALSALFFEKLLAMSGGNMRAALFYWLDALEYDESRKLVVVRPCKELTYRFMRGFDTKYLFTLAELMNHGGLTLHEHAVIFQLEPSSSRLILDYLHQIRLIDVVDEDDQGEALRYGVNPVLIHPISNTLESMNILY